MKTLRFAGLGTLILLLSLLLFPAHKVGALGGSFESFPEIDQSVIGQLQNLSPGDIKIDIVNRNVFNVTFPTTRPFPSSAKTYNDLFGGTYVDSNSDEDLQYVRINGETGTLDAFDNGSGLVSSMSKPLHLGAADTSQLKSLEITVAFKVGKVPSQSFLVYLDNGFSWRRTGNTGAVNAFVELSSASTPEVIPTQIPNFNLIGSYNRDSKAITTFETSDARTFNSCPDRTLRTDCDKLDSDHMTTSLSEEQMANNDTTFEVRWADSSGKVISSGVLIAGGLNRASGVTPDVASATEPSCESEGGSFSWLMCPALELVSGILNFIDSQLNSLLNLPDSYYKCQPDGSGCTVKNAWSRMRNLAYIILIPIMLVMVISTALGFKFVDAYTVKRAMPRLLAAVIFISLSLPIVTIMADIANGVGKGIMGLILGAVTGDNANNITLASLFDPGLASGGLLTAGLVVAGGIAIGLIGAILLFGLTAVASILVLFFVMALRQMLLVTLMIVAPLAILSWIFPGNDKLWKIWKESFTKLLLLYPIVMLLIASGKAFAYIVDGVGSGFINTILILVAYIGPYFLIKGTFKMAGSIFGNLSGMVNDRGKGVFDRLGKARQKKYQDKWHKARSGRYFNRASEGSLKNWANRKIENISNQGLGGVELRPTVRKARMKAALDERAFDHAMEASEKLPGARAHFASDVLMLAGLEGQGDRTRTMDYFRKKGISEHEAMLNTESVLAMRNAMGAEAYELAAIAKLPGTGTAFEERDTSRWHQHVGRVSHGNAGLEASLVAAGKSGFRNAQRTEVSEAGFSDHMQAVKMARNARTQKELDEITNFIVDKSYEGGGPAAVVYSRNAKVANMFAEAMERSIIKAERSGDHRIEMRAKAAVATIHEQIGNAKQVVSTVLGDRFFGKEVQYKVPVVKEKTIGEGSEKTIIRDTVYVDKTGSRLDEIQSHKGDRVFQETKFEYGQVSAEIADRLRASQPQQGQNQPGQVKPPLGGIPGQP